MPIITIKIGFNISEQKSYKECFKYSIKCHNIDVVNYFINNYLQNEDENLNEIFIHSLKYYNFSFLQNEKINESCLYDLCYYGYYLFVKDLLMNKNVDINYKKI